MQIGAFGPEKGENRPGDWLGDGQKSSMGTGQIKPPCEGAAKQ